MSDLVLRMLRMTQVVDRTGESRSGVYQKIVDRLMTSPVKLGPRASGIPEHEVQAIIAARIAGQTDDQIRELVKSLEAARAALSNNLLCWHRGIAADHPTTEHSQSDCKANTVTLTDSGETNHG